MKRPLLLLLLSAGALAACLEEGGSFYADDDDDGGPTPPPVTTDYCAIVWASESARDPSLLNYYVLDVPSTNWFSGTHAYDMAFNLGYLFYEYGESGEATLVAIANGGTWDLNAEGDLPGDAVFFEDGGMHDYFDYDAPAAKVGSGGTGFFEGFLTDPDFPEVDGFGSLHVSLLGSDLEFGTLGSYALCYEQF